MAANFNQLPSCSKRSIEKEEEDEDDDDSLYLSAREDSDSTGFLSAIGSRTNLGKTIRCENHPLLQDISMRTCYDYLILWSSTEKIPYSH